MSKGEVKMREIKFRAWHKPSRKMFSVRQMSNLGATQLIGQGKTYNICLHCKELACFTPFVWESDCELMQYTGLKDRNDIDVYEGDILYLPSGELAQVVFKHGCFVAEGKTAGMLLGKFTPEKIIGNIYENPELLEQ